MAVRIRLKKLGRRHLPFYRIVAADSRQARGGRELEVLGSYDPLEKNPERVVVINSDRVKYWLSVGGQPSETVRSLLKQKGVV